MATIFADRGNIITGLKPGDQKTDALLVINLNGQDITDTYLASAPVTGISITQIRDMTVAKTLTNNLGLLSFGSLPVSIKLTGVTLIGNLNCQRPDINHYIGNIDQFWKKSNDDQVKINLTINIAGINSTFTGYTKYIHKQSSQGNVIAYQLQIIGVRNA